MLKDLHKLKLFGVFADYTKPAGLADFGPKNIIYGWNYSGKTTLSRLFASLASKQVFKDFPSATFTLSDTDGGVTNETTIAECNHKIEVFNSDFVANNLSWSGDSFEPILLLGTESIEAEKEIARLDEMTERCRRGFAMKRDRILGLESSLADAKTRTARKIKNDLQLVEAFTATHLTNEIAAVTLSPEKWKLAGNAYTADITLALTSAKDIPPTAHKISVRPLLLYRSLDSIKILLASIPIVESTIDFLRENPEISSWVESGLKIHEGVDICHFCQNPLSGERRQSLEQHFSKAFQSHKKAIDAAVASIQSTAIEPPRLDLTSIAAAHQAEAKLCIDKLIAQIDAYNSDVKNVVEALRIKLENPFVLTTLPSIFPALESTIAKSHIDLDAVISKHNQSAHTFATDKRDAIARLKRHFAAEFCEAVDLDRLERQIALATRNRGKFHAAGLKLKERVAALRATIDRSQMGRGRLNERIAALLGASSVQIGVISVDGKERFQLVRFDQPAHNLSDGERTAIAFAYFLTKLEEHKNLGDVVVYIDDPISSLDSNHVFQVYALIETTFFKKITGANGNQEWVTSCKQIFISTHNFEFFELLKRLPCNKAKTRYFLVRRTSLTTSTIENLPDAFLKHRSEYHYLYSIIRDFHASPNKSDIEKLLALPNAMRRFLELYTYMRLPLADSTLEQRAEHLFGKDRSLRVVKLLHHFSHLESFDRVAANTNVVSDICAVVDDLMELLKEDQAHLNALNSGG